MLIKNGETQKNVISIKIDKKVGSAHSKLPPTPSKL